MHEMSIASELIRQVLAEADSHGATRVDEVVVEIGALRQVVPEALELAWQVISEGTAAEAATLKLTEVEPSARCRQCGRKFGAEIDSFLCPGCGQADVDIVAGNDIILKSLTCTCDQGVDVP